MTPAEYIRALAEALTRQEDLALREAEDILFQLALRIYALLLSQLPEGAFERQLRWPALRAEILALIMGVSDRLQGILYSRLAAAEVEILPAIARYFGLPEPTLTAAPTQGGVLAPRPLTQVLDETVVLGTSISRMFTMGARGYSPFELQLLRLLERSVLATYAHQFTTSQVASKVIDVTVRSGITYPVAHRGTVANAWRERFRAIVAGALWSTVAPAAQRASALAEKPITEWRWIAVLDPATCPVCRPLHNATAPEPDAFPQGAPPLHPLCRCVVIPVGP